MKIANIEVQNLHIILRLMILWYYYYYDTIKSRKKTGLQPLSRKHNSAKTTEGIELTPQPI